MPDTRAATLVTEPGVTIIGSAVYLLSKLLKAAPVAACVRSARWLHGADFTATVRAIHAAGHAWETSIDVPGRHNAVVKVHPVPQPGTMTSEQAAAVLQLSRRHIQRLASQGAITGRRVGGKWQLNPASVHVYQAERAA